MTNVKDKVQQWDAQSLEKAGEALVDAGVVAPPGGGAVSSVFGRSGAVLAESGDYDASQVDNDSTVSGATVADALDTLAGGAGVPYAGTIWVDPNGNPASSGRNPATPTTLTNAIATAAFSDCIVLTEGIYADADGPGTGTLTLPQSNLTFVGVQGGTGSNSVILQDAITIPARITRSRWFGVRFDGDINDNGSDGRHYFATCSSVSIAYNRSTPQRWVECNRCDFSGMTYNATGAAVSGATLTIGATTRMGPINTNGGGHTTVISGSSVVGRVTDVSGTPNTIFVAESSITDPTQAIASASGVLVAYGARCTDSAGVPVPIVVALRQSAGLVFNPSGSAGAVLPGLSSVFDSLQYTPSTPGDWAGTAPTSIQEAIDRLAAANPGA